MHHGHHNVLKLAKRKERRELYISLFVRYLGLSLIGVFIPAYFLTSGFSLFNIFLYYAVTYASYTLFTIPATMFSHKVGIKRTILLSSLGAVLFLAGLYGVGAYRFLFYPLAVYSGLATMIFWMPLHIHFVKNSSKKNISKQTSYIHFTTKLAGVIGPLAGGFLIVYLGFNLLFVISTIILLLATAPLFATKEDFNRADIDWSELINRRRLKYIKWFMFKGVFSVVAGLVFPFYIYMQTSSFAITGILAGVLGIGMALASVLVGKVSDKWGRYKTLRFSSALLAASFAAVLLFRADLVMYIASPLIGFFSTAANINVFAIFRNELAKKQATEGMVLREISLNFGRVGIFVLILLFLSVPFKLAFALAAISSIWYVFAKL